MAATDVLRRRQLERLYAGHPQNAAAILARLGGPAAATALDLARDPAGEITDQNHVGGLAALDGTARLAGLRASDRVLDVGCGLGGTARILALRFGCQVDGIDLSQERCRDARRLTALVELEGRVGIVCGDILTAELPAPAYDVILGQGVFIHFADRRPVLERCARLLAAGGRLVLEDCHLARPPRGRDEVQLTARLADCWLGHFDPLADWRADLAAARLAVLAVEDESAMLVSYFRRLLTTSPLPRDDDAMDYERGGWQQAVALAEAGVLGYFRLLAGRAG